MRCCNHGVDVTTWLMQFVFQAEPPLCACSCYTVSTCASLAQNKSSRVWQNRFPAYKASNTDRKQFETTVNTVNLRPLQLTTTKPVMCGCRWWSLGCCLSRLLLWSLKSLTFAFLSLQVVIWEAVRPREPWLCSPAGKHGVSCPGRHTCANSL